jgi:hypothetical protein
MSSDASQLETLDSQTEEVHRELVRRVIASPTFVKTERLSSFLLYICDETLKGRADGLNEQRIGEVVFGRSRDYDSSIDGIVRTQGSRLRQKLDRYFSAEGSDEPTRIVIPRGGYIPLFELREPKRPSFSIAAPELDSDVVEPLPVVPEIAAQPRQRRSFWLIAGCSIGTFALVLTLVFHFYPVSPASAKSSKHLLWSKIFVPERRTLIVPGDSGLVIWEGLEKKELNLAEFVKGDYRNSRLNSSAEDVAGDLSQRRYTSIVDLEAVQTITKIAIAQKGELETRYARDLRTDDLKQCNVILIGAAEANPWVELYEPMMKFRFFKDAVTRRFSIVNEDPQGGEPRSWDFSPGRAFAIIAYLPGFRGNGSALVIGGTSMTGTESAIDFVSDDSQLLPFLDKVRKPDGGIAHFEVVLGTQYVNNSAVRSRVLAWRTLD